MQIDPDLVERFTGQRQPCSKAEAHAGLATAREGYDRALGRYGQVLAALRIARLQLVWARFHLWLAGLPSRSGIDPWIMLSALCAGLALALSLLEILLLNVDTEVILVSCLSPILLLVLLPVLFPAERGPLDQSVNLLCGTRARLECDRLETGGELERVAADYAQARTLFEGILRTRDYPLHRLLSTDLRGMSGDQFEAFLGEVLRFLGYQVEHQVGAGDQGVDLIVNRGQRRIAVQAKCYGGSVGERGRAGGLYPDAGSRLRLWGGHHLQPVHRRGGGSG